ncbi:MAG: hypothetical protein GXY48_12260 [Methanomicrobiales archaeon]|nr:hypothetical protein [Methanomicrobiales archaeon]
MWLKESLKTGRNIPLRGKSRKRIDDLSFSSHEIALLSGNLKKQADRFSL